MKKMLPIIIFLLFLSTSCTNKADELSLQLDEAKAQLTELQDSTNAQISSYKTIINEMESAITHYESKLTSLGDSISEYKDQDIKIGNLEAIIKELKGRNQALQSKIEDHVNPLLYIFTSEEGSLTFGYRYSDKYTYQIIIESEPGSYIDSEPDNIYIESHESGTQVLVSVVGKIYNFKYMDVSWDEQSDSFINQDVIEAFDEISDTNIYIITNLPEGMPAQKIQWENESGELTEWLIGDNGLGIRGEIIHLN